MPTDPREAKIERYVENYFQRSGRTEWPTARLVARRVGCRIQQVLDIASYHPNIFQSYYATEDPEHPGDWFIETYEPPEVSHD